MHEVTFILEASIMIKLLESISFIAFCIISASCPGSMVYLSTKKNCSTLAELIAIPNAIISFPNDFRVSVSTDIYAFINCISKKECQFFNIKLLTLIGKDNEFIKNNIILLL